MSNQIANQASYALEFVTFSLSVDPKGHTKAIATNVNSLLEKQQGHLGRQTYQRVDAPQELLDLVEWSNLENALIAAKELPKTPEAAPFMQLISNIEQMAHYLPVSTHGTWPQKPAILELFAYQLQPAANQEHIIEAYSKAVTSLRGYLGRKIFRRTDSRVSFLEIVAWSSLDDARAAGPQLAQNPGLINAGKAFASVDISGRFYHPLPVDHD